MVAFIYLLSQLLVSSDIVAAFGVSRNPVLQKDMRLLAKPQRLPENAPGVVYVNDKCINCAACSHFAPDSFARNSKNTAHYVYDQPETDDEIEKAKAALQACPVAAIRLETLAERRHSAEDSHSKKDVAQSWTENEEKLVKKMTDKSLIVFPRPLYDLDNVYFIGHHNDKSFGATPYLVKGNHQGREIWIMADSPKFTPASRKAVESLTGDKGPDYLWLSHVDDTAGHDQWAALYPGMKRIMHELELENNWIGDKKLHDVEILLPRSHVTGKKLARFSLDGKVLSDDDTNDSDFTIYHAPGHSEGSAVLHFSPVGNNSDSPNKVLFTGDTYGYSTRNEGGMTAFPAYGDNLRQQADTIQKLLTLDWDFIAPGHGHSKDYRNTSPTEKKKDMEGAINSMSVSHR